jgi:hypothetical protein
LDAVSGVEDANAMLVNSGDAGEMLPGPEARAFDQRRPVALARRFVGFAVTPCTTRPGGVAAAGPVHDARRERGSLHAAALNQATLVVEIKGCGGSRLAARRAG